MRMHKLSGTIKYTDPRDNPQSAQFAYELQCSSNHEEQRKLIIGKWLADDAPVTVSSSDISDIDFRAVALTDAEMAERYGAVQGRLV